MVGVQAAKRMIDSQADLGGVDVETVTYIDTDTDGDTFRVLETDGETEAEQVGFQITHPGGPMGDRMFKDRLKQYFDALREQQRGDGDTDETNEVPDPDPPAEYDDDDPDVEADGTTTTEVNPESGTQTPDADRMAADRSGSTEHKRIALDLQLTGGSVDTLREELADVTEDQTELERMNARLDDIEDRVETLESALDALASVGQQTDQE